MNCSDLEKYREFKHEYKELKHAQFLTSLEN